MNLSRPQEPWIKEVTELKTAPSQAWCCHRKDLLRLHGMANTILNNAPKTISSDREKIWELAGSLAMELEEMVEDLGATLEGLHQLAKLAPEFAEGDTEEEDS